MERWVGLGVIALSTSVAGSHYSEHEIAGWWCDEHEAEKMANESLPSTPPHLATKNRYQNQYFRDEK